MYLVHNFSRFSSWLLLPMHHGGKSMSQRRVENTERKHRFYASIFSPFYSVVLQSMDAARYVWGGGEQENLQTAEHADCHPGEAGRNSSSAGLSGRFESLTPDSLF